MIRHVSSVSPQRLKPHPRQGLDRSAEALRHPKPSSILPKSSLMWNFSRHLLFASVSTAILLCGLSTSARAANSASGDAVLRALREDMDRSKSQPKL